VSRATASLFAFEPGAPGVPAGSGTGAFVTGLLTLLTRSLDLRTRWLRPAAEPRARGELAEAVAAAGWMGAELRGMLADRSRYLIFIYPKVPVLAHVEQPTLLALARRAYQALAWKARLAGQRIIVIVEDLPIEMAEGRAAAGGPRPELPADRIREIEDTLLGSAHRIVAPVGFVDTIRRLHEIEADRFRTFRRNVYRPGTPADPEEEPPRAAELPFQSGDVDFFYSGFIDSSVAPNFRDALRSIRQAPGARLHVCGPEPDAVRDWFEELDVPNARHYGRLPPDVHDALARRCDVGLILYPVDNPYNHLTPTMKYSAYVANGLAILSTDLRSVAENLRHDGVGRAMPIPELTLELLRWTTRTRLFDGFRERARALAPEVRSGKEMQAWIDEIARGE
jgi:hypothetical protein